MANNHLQNTTQKTKDRATQIPRKTGGEHGRYGSYLLIDARKAYIFSGARDGDPFSAKFKKKRNF